MTLRALDRACRAALAVAALAACHGPADPAVAQVRRYADLVRRGKLAAAYALLAPAYKVTCDLSCFARRVAAEPGAAAQTLEQLARGAYGVERSATLTLGPQELRLVEGHGTWSLAGDPLDFYPQDGPQQALRSFLLALERRRYDVALRFVPPRLRGDVTEAALRERWDGPGAVRQSLTGQIQAVRQHLHEPLIVEGGEARLPLGERREVRLLEDGGRWYVVQLQ